MAGLSALTIIILSYKRRNYALRSLKYWSGKGVRVHLLDGSAESIPDNLLQGLEENVTYHHLYKSLFERMRIGTELVETEYSILLGDDEFFLPSALQSCVDELEEDRSLVACMGRTLAFKMDGERVIGYPFYTEMDNYAVLDNNPINRVIYHLDNYVCSTIYAVVRTSVWKTAIIGATEELSGSDFELQFEIIVSFYGKSKVIPVLMWLRGFEVVSIRSAAPAWYDANKIPEIWLDPNRVNEREIFLDFMVKYLKVRSKIDGHIIYQGICDALDAFTNKNTFFKRHVDFIKEVMFNLIASSLNRRIKQLIRRYLKIFLPLPTLQQAGIEFANTGCSVDLVGLMEIETLVKAFHNGVEK